MIKSRTPSLSLIGGALLGSAVFACLPFTEARASEESGGLPQFNAEWFPSQIFWLAVTFAILYVFFSRRALPRIQNTIEARQKNIQSDLDAATELSTRASAIRTAYERNMARAKDRASDAMRQADTQLKVKTADMLYTYRTKFTQEIARAENELSGIRARLVAEMEAVAAEVAAHATSNILHTPADLDEAQSIVNDLAKQQKAA